MIAHETTPVPQYAEEVILGLTSPHKTLPCKLFYDEIGSALFEEITRLPEYYPTRTELEILRKYSREIAVSAGSPISVVELGAGTATKTEMLLRAISWRQMRVKFFPVDISPSALSEAGKRLRAELPGALVRPVIADFSDGFHFLNGISGASWSCISVPALATSTGMMQSLCSAKFAINSARTMLCFWAPIW